MIDWQKAEHRAHELLAQYPESTRLTEKQLERAALSGDKRCMRVWRLKMAVETFRKAQAEQ